MKENLLCATGAKGFQPCKFSAEFKKPAFSLVEMLMALLVASLLLAALAPVMTRRFNDNVNVNSIGGGSKSDYSRTFYEDFEWSVPNGVNIIKVTSVGGGGAGGGASYGYQEFTSTTNNWTVPNGVTKLRVFMIGAGGGGASGGNGNLVHYDSFPEATETSTDYGVGQTNVTLNGARIPDIYVKCKNSGIDYWNLVSEVNNASITMPNKYTPGRYMFKVTACGGGGGGANKAAGTNNASTNSYEQGGGGGGSGGYIKDAVFKDLTSPNLVIAVGGGGNTAKYGAGNWGQGSGNVSASGASGGTYGGTGGWGYNLSNGGNGGDGKGLALSSGGQGAAHSGWGQGGTGGRGGLWGGGGGGGGGGEGTSAFGHALGGAGGGGPTTILTSGALGSDNLPIAGNILLQVGGGGGGGGARLYRNDATGGTAGAGGGGGGGGYGGGGGGAGGACTNQDVMQTSAGSGGALYSSLIGIGKGNSGTGSTWNGYGGGGGGGYGGNSGCRGDVTAAYCGNVKGGGGVISTVFGNNYCNGGNAGAYAGKDGRLRITYGGSNVFQCKYYQTVNSGAGGGAGQIWIGEISVTPGQKLNFNVGQGGSAITAYEQNGNNGGDTSISVGATALISVSGGKGGKYESSDNETYINNTYGVGGGVKTTSATVGSNVVKYVNWKKTNFHSGGENGGSAKSYSNGAGGGKGGQLYGLDGTLYRGGNGGGAEANGSDAVSTNYGAGGGGGGGIVNGSFSAAAGYGGKGANGYIYIEWGSTNGGGGAGGQIVNENSVWVTPGTKIQITVGKGGKASEILTTQNGVEGQFGLKGNNGEDSFITTNEGIKARAKGGEGGYPGSSVHGKGGNYCKDNEGNNITGSADGGNCASKSPNYINNSVSGEDGTDEYGGIGGSITEEICPLFDSLMGLGGCGGSMPNGNCNGASSTGNGKNAGKTGGGGGGGSVKENQAYPGGNGANGMVVIDWSN